MSQATLRNDAALKKTAPQQVGQPRSGKALAPLADGRPDMASAPGGTGHDQPAGRFVLIRVRTSEKCLAYGFVF